MKNHQTDTDLCDIKEIIARQFRSLSWSKESSGDWAGFAADFHTEATLFPAARPAKGQSVQAFIERLSQLADNSLHTFDEKLLGVDIFTFGNIAVAIAGCETTENEVVHQRNVEIMLLVKSENQWQIVSQVWDSEGENNKLPGKLEINYEC